MATLKLPAREVQTGGFGSPNGLAGTPGGNPGNVVKLGSFALPSGGGYGNGSGRTHGALGTVASAGFSNGIVSAGGAAMGKAKLAGASCGQVDSTPNPPHRHP